MHRRAFIAGIASAIFATTIGSTAHAFGQPMMDDPILLNAAGETGSDAGVAKPKSHSMSNHVYLSRMKKKRAKRKRRRARRRR